MASPTVLEAKPRQQKLIEGRRMRCPRCKRPQDILEYVPLMQIEEFVDDTTPVYKCPSCRWIFAPAEAIVLNIAPLMEEQ